VTAGISASRIAAYLNTYRATAFPAETPWIKLHTGDPGAAGTANASAVTTRNQLTLNAPSGGAATLSALAAWTMTGVETITHISIHDASSGGNFRESWALGTPVPVIAGSTLTLTVLTISIAPVAS
jgi:hypothetical protein